MNCEIIAVGTELLLGNILNTDAQFLSEELSALGIDVFFQTVVGDNKDRLKVSIETALSRADMLILSGGLGPTDDDLTKETAAECLGLSMCYDEESAENMKKYLRCNLSKSNLKQAYIPEGAIVLRNDNGTAPGVIMEKEDKIIILLPGPPKELIPMFNEKVKPYLEKRSDYVMKSKTLRLFGIGESMVGDTVRDLMQNSNPTVAPYAKDNETILRITAKAESTNEANEKILDMTEKIKERLGEYIYSYDNVEMKNTVAELLLANNLKIAAAESCTAGLFTAALGDIPGISASLCEGIITYSNEAKMKYLGVKKETLDSFGAVSEKTACEMAEGIKKTACADIGVSITGIAGPDGGTDKKPVGLVYVGVCTKNGTKAYELRLRGSRNKIRSSAVMNALNAVRTAIINEKGQI